MENKELNVFSLGIPDYMSGTKWIIFKKALDMFAQQGIEAVSMRDIAKAAGIKAASIYNHFSSKERIVEEMYHYCEMKSLPIYDYTDELVNYNEGESSIDIMSKFVLCIEPEENYVLNQIFHIAMSRMRTDERARKVIERQFQKNFEIIRKVLYKMQGENRIRNIDIDNFVTLYQHLCFSASYNIDTFMSIPFSKWIEINNFIFSLILNEPSDNTGGSSDEDLLL